MQDILFDFLKQEQLRQKNGINLIASENYAPEDVRCMVGSELMNKYVEGNVGARYYSGCEFVDKIEQEAIDRFKKLFNAEHVNVQPHSGSQANFAVYAALLSPGDTILSMKLSDGGHLTHGHGVNLSGKLYNIVFYGVDSKTHLIDYDKVQNLALEHKPKLIIAGASSYARIIDFAILTNDIMQGAFNLKVDEYKKVKGVAKGNLRDHMTDLELIITMLGEATTTQLTKQNNSQGVPALRKDAKNGGAVAGRTRKDIEQELGKSIIYKASIVSLKKDIES